MSPPAHFDNTGTCIQQSHKMVTHLPVAFIEIVSVPFAPTFHIHVNQAIPHDNIRLLDMLLKTKWTWHWLTRLITGITSSPCTNKYHLESDQSDSLIPQYFWGERLGSVAILKNLQIFFIWRGLVGAVLMSPSAIATLSLWWHNWYTNSSSSTTCTTCFLHCSFTSKAPRTFVTLQFAGPMIQKLLNLVKEWGKYWTIFNDKYIFSDGWFYPTLLQFLMWQFLKKQWWSS
jgi:hypothetical protein